jgi:hypothetical protein
MTAPDPTLHDVWRLLGSMNRRINERLDAIEHRLVVGETRSAAIEARVSEGEARLGAKLSALRESIEARDFRLDEHGRRLTKLEESLP